MTDAADPIYRTLFESVGIGIYQTTLSGRLVRVNPAQADMFGFDSPEQMVAEITDIGRQIYVDPTARDRFLERFRTGDRVTGFVSRCRRRDGTTLWLSETARLTETPEGEPTIIGTSADVTELMETEEALRVAEENYRGIFENATEGIYWSSLDGKQLRANPALVRLNGYASEAEMLAAVNDIATEWYVDPERRRTFERLMALHGSVQNFESEIYRHKTRERIWISENARVVRDKDGRPLHYEGTVRDITQRRQAEQALLRAMEEAEAASRAKSRFLATMSHELRTPLNAIMGFSELMMTEAFGPLGNPRYADYVADIRASADLLLRLIEDVLDVAKAEAGRIDLDEAPVDVVHTVQLSIRLLRERARRADITLEARLPPDLPPVLADERRLRQIVLNLLSNAVKFTPENGRVEVRVERAPDGGLLLTVTDTGIGIDPTDLPRVFEPFFQRDDASARRPDGTGLGLSLSRSLVERHGGTLTLRSAPGQGTEATLWLPPSRILADSPLPDPAG